MSDYFFNDAIDLKLIILFIAENFKRPVTIADVTGIAALHDYANYFQMAQSFCELLDTALMREASEKGYYIVTEKGQNAYDLFAATLPYTVKEVLLSSIAGQRQEEREALSVVAEYQKNRAAGYDLFCEISESGIPLLSLSLPLPSEDIAKRACHQFRERAQTIYADIVKNLT